MSAFRWYKKYVYIVFFADMINEFETGEHNCDADHMYCIKQHQVEGWWTTVNWQRVLHNSC